MWLSRGVARLDTKELTELEQAEKDLRFYAAIIGHRPEMSHDAPADVVVEPVTPEPEPAAAPEPMKFAIESVADLTDLPPIPPKPDKPHALRLWMRDLSSKARKRIDEAYHRLAS